MSDHRARYKNAGLDAKELRRRREEDSLQLRKQKRDDVLSKKRTLAPIDNNSGELSDENESIENDTPLTLTPEVIQLINQSRDDKVLIESAQVVRRILSKEPQPPFDEVINSGLVPRFVELLDHQNPTIQFEVAWILTNICSGTSEQTRCVVNHGAVPKLISLLSSPDLRVCEQAVWALGNIIGDGAELRAFVIECGVIPALLALIRPDIDLGFLRNETWVIVNLCRYKDPPPSLDAIKQLLPAVQYLLQSTDLAVLVDIAWAVSYITDQGPDYSQLIIDSGILSQMIPLLSHKDLKVITAAVRALGCIVVGNEEQTQAVIDGGALPHLNRILKEGQDRIIKEALWFVSNISAGSSNQVQALIDNGILPSIVYHLENKDFTLQREAAWAVYNLGLSSTPKQIQSLVEENVIPPLCNLLNQKDYTLVTHVLEALSCILAACEDSEVRESIEACGGLDTIEELQSHVNPEIYNFAYNIIDQYFSDDTH